jgi:hypothetical protein
MRRDDRKIALTKTRVNEVRYFKEKNLKVNKAIWRPLLGVTVFRCN